MATNAKLHKTATKQINDDVYMLGGGNLLHTVPWPGDMTIRNLADIYVNHGIHTFGYMHTQQSA